MEWCYVAASVVGLSHIRAGTRLQDAKHCFVSSKTDGRPVFFAVVADGAGSAKFGGQGATIVCRTFASQARDALRGTSELPDDETIWSWLDIARDRIQLAAKKRELTARDFATTLVLVIASPDAIVTAHIGDGAIVARDRVSAQWNVMSEPHHGEYASTTYFVTDDPQPAMRIGRHLNGFSAIAAFSDGIENLVLDSVTGAAYAGFFAPMAKPLDASIKTGRDCALSESLAAFLASDRLNERTDDDKTLIVAVLK
ncbi:protein phosphatase 2C domain-containing protein [Prosthecomicrobium hirschii]|uniref:PP2C family serine/threonine-protein phosphatase n=1 Tax=Prosthecodimorpha hirschii TaxID=665126 RepID=UPI001127B0C5|nr:PP2C family serine/threonine-protein phosphatase [Prosthecomicrobium hirschii]TPQ49376.1 protein phosphatase 2C domain-containing protein [Prosthecomicrobium hirschii]